MTRSHEIALKIAELIEKAPAGGLFHDAVVSPPVTIDGGPSHMSVTLDSLLTYDVIITARK
jgi:hypothetical protein